MKGYGVLRQCAEYGNDFHVRLYIHMAGRMYPRSTTALMLAAQNGHIECVRLLLGYERNKRDIFGKTALMLAVEKCHIELSIC